MAMCHECFTRVFSPEQYSVCSECQILSCDECRGVCYDCYAVFCGCCYEAHPCFNEMEEEEEEEEDNEDDDDGSRGGAGEEDEQGSKEEKGQEFSMANSNEVLLGSKNKSQKDDTPDR